MHDERYFNRFLGTHKSLTDLQLSSVMELLNTLDLLLHTPW